MKRWDATVISAVAAHALAWAVGLLFALGPIYQGVSVTTMTSGDIASESTRVTATLIEVNGLRALLLLAVPILLTALALSSVLLTDAGQARRKVSLWVPAVMLLGFCAVGIFSIGLFYLPAALALVISAVLGSRGRAAESA